MQDQDTSVSQVITLPLKRLSFFAIQPISGCAVPIVLPIAGLLQSGRSGHLDPTDGRKRFDIVIGDNSGFVFSARDGPPQLIDST
jgi:hypothetical protein